MQTQARTDSMRALTVEVRNVLDQNGTSCMYKFISVPFDNGESAESVWGRAQTIANGMYPNNGGIIASSYHQKDCWVDCGVAKSSTFSELFPPKFDGMTDMPAWSSLMLSDSEGV